MKSPKNTDTQRAAVAHQRLILHRVPGKSHDTGKHQWSYGTTIRWDSWNHAPSHFMRGPCPNCGWPTSTYGGGWTCHNDYCPSSANNFACSAGPKPEWWETQVNVFLDGDAWCATLDGFVNLQESVAGFGKTPRDAVENLNTENTMTIIKSGKTKKPKPTIAECRGCDCKFSFTKNEARYESDTRNGAAYVVKCPECRHENWIDASLVG